MNLPVRHDYEETAKKRSRLMNHECWKGDVFWMITGRTEDFISLETRDMIISGLSISFLFFVMMTAQTLAWRRKVDRVTANHYLSLTASQETSNIPFP